MARRQHPVSKYGKRTLERLNKVIAAQSIYPEKDFYERDEFPWVGAVESRWRAIRAELEEVLKDRDRIPRFHDVSKDQYNMSCDGRWKTFFFYAYGRRADANCAKCPRTTEALQCIPGMKTAFFSILSGPKHIPRHRGPYKGVLRYHLGLIVPGAPGDCRIQVGDQVRQWTEGQSLIFDDTFPHQAWNDTDEERVVLFVDFERPMRPVASVINRSLIELIAQSPFVQDGVRNLRAWRDMLPPTNPTEPRGF